ncbi:DUF3052 family protein [Telmatocola sphagniphila]|uniref:DUF3052 family protein n=1 Tax=Telmatocola sphagniphila TaxID=1123043 RepID=A0A8E6B9E5_9BACT|nr:DUF3052 family protein [Telmatocola sphagniphila]QVL34302.1 DUF3052 family protein [Telmatocola sphagniphila]
MERDYSHRTRLQKLGIKPESLVFIQGEMDEDFLAEVESQRANADKCDVLLARVEEMKDLKVFAKLHLKMQPAAGLWIVYPKGKKHIREADVRAAGLTAGLVDNKVVSFSETHTALRFVIPLANRPKEKSEPSGN